jgi:hypothetical protein
MAAVPINDQVNRHLDEYLAKLEADMKQAAADLDFGDRYGTTQTTSAPACDQNPARAGLRQV